MLHGGRSPLSVGLRTAPALTSCDVERQSCGVESSRRSLSLIQQTKLSEMLEEVHQIVAHPIRAVILEGG